ncbi:hypothetical protein DRO59_04540 [Candidatus Bathyarchaeota archaeon]|nr:MAG: hypothetical protein DRO59_04540 [Candidatus Bathyarchaeota archaeon]
MKQVPPNKLITLAFDFVCDGATVIVEEPKVDIYSLSQVLITTTTLTWSGIHYEAQIQSPEDTGPYVAVAHGEYNGDFVTASSYVTFEVVPYEVEAHRALVTLDEAKEYLGISDFSEDSFLRFLVESSVASILNYLHFTLGVHTANEIYPVTNCTTWSLKHYPINSIEHLSVDEVALDDYTLDSNTGTIWFEEPVSGILRVEYTYGLVDVPYDLKLACLKFISVLYNLRQTEGYSSRRLLSVAETYLVSSKADVFHEIRSLLAPYKRVVT